MLLDRMDTIDPDSPARFSLLAGEPGEYPIELVEADRQIGTLVIRGLGLALRRPARRGPAGSARCPRTTGR